MTLLCYHKFCQTIFFLLQLQYVGHIYSAIQNVRIAEHHILQMVPPT